MNQSIDKTALSYWFPLLVAAGLPVPKTTILDMPRNAQECIWRAFDGEDGDEEQSAALQAFTIKIGGAMRAIGIPAFLRTDHTSGKHNWIRTCYLDSDDARKIGSHIFAIVEFSELCDMIGLPWDRWVVREYLPIMPLGTCPEYGDMPLCREFRFFIDDGAVKCWHPYWPKHAIRRGGADVSLFEKLAARPDDSVFELASKTAKTIEGAWSVDILETERGWFVTDMAEAHKSFHWEGCEHASKTA